HNLKNHSTGYRQKSRILALLPYVKKRSRNSDDWVFPPCVMKNGNTRVSAACLVIMITSYRLMKRYHLTQLISTNSNCRATMKRMWLCLSTVNFQRSTPISFQINWYCCRLNTRLMENMLKLSALISDIAANITRTVSMH